MTIALLIFAGISTAALCAIAAGVSDIARRVENIDARGQLDFDARRAGQTVTIPPAPQTHPGPGHGIRRP